MGAGAAANNPPSPVETKSFAISLTSPASRTAAAIANGAATTAYV